MDLVYLCTDQSNCDHLELRYSIRSMVKHLHGFNDIIIVGHQPAFLKNVIHLPAEDQHPNNRAKNIYEKIMAACLQPHVSETFICCSDDYFLLQDYEADTFPYYQCGDLFDALRRLSSGNYYRLHVQNTYDALKSLGFNTLNFNVHSPIVYHKQAFCEAVSHFDWSIPRGYISKSVYCNVLNIAGEFLPDCKLHTPKTKTAIYRYLQDKPMFSTNEHSINEPMKEVLQELYPEKSNFEK
jgi:hypothetical protein